MTQTIIIDTREPDEYTVSHVDSAINIPPSEFLNDNVPEQLRPVALDTEIIVYCRTGQRSNTVGQLLRRHGFETIVNGINEQHVRKLIQTR